MKGSSTTAIFLRRQRRRARGTLLAWAAAATFAAQAWGLAAGRGSIAASSLWQLIPAAIAAYLLWRWARRVHGLTPRQLAREIDAQWNLNARVESAVELHDADSPLAAAQRTDADAALRNRKPRGTPVWLAGLMAATIAGLSAGLLQLSANRPASVPVPIAHPRPAAALPPPRPEPSHASLDWVSPAKLIHARMTDEVPLVVRAESNRGFRAATLEVALNGAPIVTHDLPAGELAAIASPGRADLKLALFLDETGAKPYDIVSYLVRAETRTPPEPLTVRSRSQIVEISPATPEDDTTLSAESRDLLQRLAALRRAEAEVAADTHALTPSASLAIDLERSQRATDVMQRQSKLARDSGTAQNVATAARANASVTSALANATNAMERASTELTAGRAPAASPHQAQALTALADTERLFRATLENEKAKAPATATATTPRTDSATSPPTRASAPAGRLEQLWHRQNAINRQLPETETDSTKITPLASEQQLIVRDLERLLAQRGLIEPVQQIVENARKPAAEAARQLALNDTLASREPATQAEALLKRALDLQEQEGRKAASALLEQVRGDLASSRTLDAATQAARQEQTMHQLGAEAERQNQQGSADAAERLASLAKKLAEAAASKPSDKAQPEQSSDSSQSATPAAAGASSNDEGDRAKPAESGQKSGSGPKTYIAQLRPKPGASGSTATGQARLVVQADGAEAQLSVTVDHLGGTPAGGHLDVETATGATVRVFTLPSGTISQEPWKLAPVGGLSQHDLLQALESGRISVELASTRFRAGELRGKFASAAQTSGNSTASIDGPRSTPSTQPSVAMPTLSADAGTTRGPALDLSTIAAESQVALAPDNSLAQTIRQFKAASARASRADDRGVSIANLRLAAEKAQWLTTDPKTAAAARAIASGATDLSHPETVDPAVLKTLLEEADKLVNELERAQPATPRDEWVRRFPPDEIDPTYRKPVQDYFEQLSREGAVR